MYENMIRQAAMLSFADVFYLLTWMMIILIPLVFFMKNSTSKGKIQPGAD
jgi:hypothetical protein